MKLLCLCALIASSASANDLDGHLINWQSALARLASTASPPAPAVIAWFGDSWTCNGAVTIVLEARLQMRLGNAGAGYVPLDSASCTTYPAGTTVTTAGTWTDLSGSLSHGLQSASTTSIDLATPASKTVTSTVTSFVIHWWGQVGGGSVTYQVDGGGATTINTSSLGGYQTTVVSGLAKGIHSLTVTLSATGTNSPILNGVECRIDNVGGVRFNNISHNGSTANDFTLVPSADWESGISALAPHAVVMMWGVNEHNAGISPASQSSSLTTLLSEINAAGSLIDVVLASEGDVGIPDVGYSMAQYDVAQKGLAVGQGIAFLSGYTLLGSYSTANARGLYLNTGHLNGAGGEVLAMSYYSSFTSGIDFTLGFWNNYLLGTTTDDHIHKLQVAGSVLSNGAIDQSTSGNSYSLWKTSTNNAIVQGFQNSLGTWYAGLGAYSGNGRHYQIHDSTNNKLMLDIGENGGTVNIGGPVGVNNGSHIVYRCTVAGTLAIGQFTVTASDCGTAVDSGLRTQ